MKLISFITFILYLNVISLSQNDNIDYSEFLIPYNDNGSWGWCDTNGTIIIEPQYKKTSFFTKIILNDEERLMAKIVFENDNINYLIDNNNLLVPANYSIKGHINSNNKIDKNQNIKIVSKDGKLGIYDCNGKINLVKPEFDNISEISGFIYLKKNNKKYYYQYKLDKKKLSKTNIVKIESYLDNSNYFAFEIKIFTDHKGHSYEAKNGKLMPFQLKEKKDVLIKDYGIVIDDSYESFSQENRIPYKNGVVKTYDFSKYSFIKKYGFTSLSLIFKDGKYGVIDNNNKVVLAFEYDEVIFENGNTQARLVKNNKIGRKIFFTHYPTIPAKFYKLEVYNELKVSKSWSFAIFSAELNGNNCFVGENGVEYFNFSK